MRGRAAHVLGSSGIGYGTDKRISSSASDKATTHYPSVRLSFFAFVMEQACGIVPIPNVTPVGTALVGCPATDKFCISIPYFSATDLCGISVPYFNATDQFCTAIP